MVNNTSSQPFSDIRINMSRNMDNGKEYHFSDLVKFIYNDEICYSYIIFYDPTNKNLKLRYSYNIYYNTLKEVSEDDIEIVWTERWNKMKELIVDSLI